MKNKLKYADEEDKSYGITGMAISMMVWDSEHLLSEISIDGPADDSIRFTPEFFLTDNPRLSAKIAWTRRLKHFQLSAGMLISNVMCRSYMHRHKEMSDDMKSVLHSLIKEEGHDMCSLDDDEIDAIFDKSFSYLDRIF